MSYIDLFITVAKHVRSKGVPVEIWRSPPITDEKIEAARLALSVPLPESLIELYRDVGDGLRFLWHAEKNLKNRGPSAVVEILPLEELVARHQERQAGSIVFEEDYQYRHVDDPALAQVTAARMRNWLEFHWEGNGDSFCLDLGSPSCPVVFNTHDWFDGGTGFNGFPIGDTLEDFFHHWARACFQAPSSLWWPSVLSPAGVKWNNKQFSTDFMLPTIGR